MVHQELGKEENKANFNGVKAQLGWAKKSKPKKIGEIFWQKKFGFQMNCWSQKILGPKKILGQKSLSKNIWVPRTFRCKKILGPKELSVLKIVGPKKLETIKFWVEEKFGTKNVGPKKI